MLKGRQSPTGLLGLMVMLAGLFSWSQARAEGVTPPLRHVPAAVCGECHQEIYQQWASSLHAQSSALNDPIHGAFYRMLVGDPTQEGVRQRGSGEFPGCLQCHAPNAARDGRTRLDAMEAYSEGVNCVACHSMGRYLGVTDEHGHIVHLGAAAYEYSPDHLQGPYGAFNGQSPALAPGSGTPEPSVNPYPHEGNGALFQSADACLGCHDQRNNPHGVPVCATGPELTASGAPVVCQSCHMPSAGGFANHAMGGGHDPAMLRRATILDLSLERAGELIQATVSLRNLLAHNFPTGAPFRWAAIQVSALDADGEPVWRNYATNPIAEDNGAVMMLKLVDGEGHPAPPPKATAIAGDTRLQPGETREFIFPIPYQGVASVRVELHYGLLLPPIVAQMGDRLPEALRQPTLVERVERTL